MITLNILFFFHHLVSFSPSLLPFPCFSPPPLSSPSLSIQAELLRQEELVYRERKERESILTSYKKQAEERKAQAERVERRVSDIGTAHSALP